MTGYTGSLGKLGEGRAIVTPDSFLGLCSMVEVALGQRDAGTPVGERLRVEGWILGQETKAHRSTSRGQ